MNSWNGFLKVAWAFFAVFNTANLNNCYAHLEITEEHQLAVNRTKDNRQLTESYI